jgi:YggT family protein
MGSFAIILLSFLSLVKWVVIIHIVMSWLINFDVINTKQNVVRATWNTLERLVEPVYTPIRNTLPSLGGLDLAPLVVIFGVFALQTVITQNMLG